MGENKFDAIARQRAGQVAGFFGADESIEAFEERTASEEQTTDTADAETAPAHPAGSAPYWPTV